MNSFEFIESKLTLVRQPGCFCSIVELTGRKEQMRRRAEQDPNLSWLSCGFLLLWQQWQRECQDELQFGQHKQTQERDVIKKSEASGLAAHTSLKFCSPTTRPDICVVLSFSLARGVSLRTLHRLPLWCFHMLANDVCCGSLKPAPCETF